MLTAASLLFAYLIGMFPSAKLTCKLLNLPDPSQHGSHNPGATNVLRIGGKKAGIITLLADASKGALAISIGHAIDAPNMTLGLIAFAVCLGHIFPITSRFKGGKGVATFFGAMWALSLPIASIASSIWALCAFLSRYASLASIVAATSAIITSIILHQYPIGISMTCLLVIGRHHSNITRLISGKESQLGQAKRQ